MQKRIIDNRKKEKFMIDDEYLNGQAKLCGWQGTIVYISLCRHSNKNQECFPSIKLMAEENGVSRNTIIKGLKNLESRRVISITKKRRQDGKWLNNVYILTDKSTWDYNQVLEKDTVSQVPLRTSPSPSQNKTKSFSGTLRKHIEGNTSKETHSDFYKFWNLYDKKVDKYKCELKWKNLSEKEKSEIIKNAPLYKQAHPTKKYRKNPLTYLNGRCWEDEITQNKSIIIRK